MERRDTTVSLSSAQFSRRLDSHLPPRNKFSINILNKSNEKKGPAHDMYGHGGIVTTVNELLSINLPRDKSRHWHAKSMGLGTRG